MAKRTSQPESNRTRRAIVDHLKAHGPHDAQTLAEAMGVTAMAVRQHLYALQDEKLVTFDKEKESRKVGRPAKLWKLTESADQFFPNGHAELTVELLRNIRESFGAEGMDRLLAVRARKMADAYAEALPNTGSLRRRLCALAKLRTQEGYMANVETAEDGALLLIENHCPICEAAAECQGLCAIELDVFRSALGVGVRVERTDHIQAGARRCAYRVTTSE